MLHIPEMPYPFGDNSQNGPHPNSYAPMHPSGGYNNFPPGFQPLDSRSVGYSSPSDVLSYRRQPLQPFKQELPMPESQTPMMHGHILSAPPLPGVDVSNIPNLHHLNTVSPHHSHQPHPPNDLHLPHHLSHSHYQNSPPIDNSQVNHESHFSSSPVQSSNSHASAPQSHHSRLRFEVLLEAPTAAAQRIDENTMTYLNKGQSYAFTLNDQEKFEGDITSVIRIMFHDESHRKMSKTYWNFWFNQQSYQKNPRAIDIDKASSSGVKNIEHKGFDRITFDWNGKKGAKLFIKFNCLSTDFSRIKGVKGIPLRVMMESKIENHSNLSVIEKSFSKIKLFRDKGAERKNKDDAKHLDKMWEKIRKSNSDSGPLLMMYAPVSPVTMFTECPANDPPDQEEEITFDDSYIEPEDPEINSHGKRRRPSDFPDVVDIDLSYRPIPRKRRSVLALYVQFMGESIYRAIYLERFTVEDLIQKICDKLEIQPSSISSIVRVTKKGLNVRVDDSMVSQMEDEQSLEVDYSFNNEANESNVSLTLKY